MLLRLRQDNRRFVVNIPDGSWLVKTRYGYPALAIPAAGPRGQDVYVLAPRIRDVAARGLHGMSLCEEGGATLVARF
jgi:hypothetical protein